jgi:hypothetical protein
MSRRIAEEGLQAEARVEVPLLSLKDNAGRT